MIAGFLPLLESVQRNCHIADARHAREMTLCTYLLEMREFCRWEHDLPPGAPPPKADIKRWISDREALWEALADEDFAPLPVAGGRVDPFEAKAVNEALLPAGLVYGAGVGRFHKPHFFLGRLVRREQVDDLTVLVCGCEYARDLTAIPAALQGGTVIVRQESLRQWLWEKAEAWGIKRQTGPMARALEGYGAAGDPAAMLDRMAEAETDAVILHERGEHAAGRLLGPDWESMVAGFASRRPELLARAVRDHLADCLSTLPALVERKAWPSIHFWFANLDGMRRELFPRLLLAYEDWVATGNPDGLVETAGAGRLYWRDLADRLLDIHRREGGGVEEQFAAMSQDIRALAL